MSVWSLCVCLWAGWVLGGGSCAAAGVGVNSEVSIDDTKTVKECRVHIEKALEEYWDKAEPSTDAARSNIQLDSNPVQEVNYDSKEETPCVGENNCDRNDISESNPGKDTVVNQLDDDEDDDDDDEDDDDDDTESTGDDNSQEGTDPQKSDSNSSADESEDDQNVETQSPISEESNKLTSGDTKASSSGEASQEARRVYVVKNLNKEPIEFDDLNSDKADEDKKKDIEVAKVTEDDDDDDDDEEDDDDDETDDSQEVEDQDTDDTESKVVNEIEENKTVSEEQKEEVKKEEASQKATAEEVKIPEATKESESLGSNIASDQNKLQINSTKVLEEKTSPASEIQPSVVVQSVVEPSQLVTETPEVPKKAQLETPKVITKKETGPELSLKEELIENIYEDEDDDDDDDDGLTYRNRNHIDAILGLDEVGTEVEKEEEKLAQSIYKDIKKIELTHIKPMELLYKFADSTTRSLGDAEIFNRPIILFLGPWNSGKTSIINYILGTERTPSALETGTGITDVDFTVITHGAQRRVISGTELVTDWRYSGVQKFGQGFLDHLRSIHIPHALLQKVTIIDTPGILENKKTAERGYSLNDAFQWFIDRADAIYVVLDPNKVDIGGELSAVIDQLKGREVRFVLNKADSIRRSDLMRVVGQLFWNLSPLMSSSEAPVIYAVSLTTHPYHPSAPTRFLDDQEKNLLYDMRGTLDKRVENRILYARKHAVKVRNHAKMVDCYLATFYRHKYIFSNKRNVAKQIVENPGEYSIYDGISSMTNMSRYDLPSPAIYKDFFRTHALYDFKPLASTCSYFRGCPMDKLDEAIAKDIPELMARYKKAKIAVQEVTTEGKR